MLWAGLAEAAVAGAWRRHVASEVRAGDRMRLDCGYQPQQRHGAQGGEDQDRHANDQLAEEVAVRARGSCDPRVAGDRCRRADVQADQRRGRHHQDHHDHELRKDGRDEHLC